MREFIKNKLCRMQYRKVKRGKGIKKRGGKVYIKSVKKEVHNRAETVHEYK